MRALSLRIQARWVVQVELELLDDLTLYVSVRPSEGVQHSIHPGARGQGFTVTTWFEGPGEEVDHFVASPEAALKVLSEVLEE